MTLHIFRVTVGGQFAGLPDDVRAALVADASEHAVARAAFTRDGTFTYELPLVSFSYRYEVRVDDEEHDAPVDEAGRRAEALARTDLVTRGIDARHVRTQPTDMADLWRRERR